MYPERFSNLPAYAFPRLRALLDAHAPGGEVVHMSIGEPTHAFPEWVTEIIAEHTSEFGRYPVNEGTPELRQAIAGWLQRRYGVDVDPDTRVMALNGTREGLYNAMMALCPETKGGERPVVLMPNPFYQVYMIAAISVGAEPVFLPCTAETGFLPDFSALSPDILRRVSVAYLCSPSNPQGAMASRAYWADLLRLAETYDFRVFADECYAEIYRDAAPVGVLEVAREVGADPERVVAFHSLSKRSNVPGLRSGFVVAGPRSMHEIRQLRAYSGSPVPMPLQAASARLWADDAHVVHNRQLYQEKYALAEQIFGGVPGYQTPQAGFFLWLPVSDGEEAALKIWRETGVRVLPGAYLSRESNGFNPGKSYIRAALVAPISETEAGLTRLRNCLYK